MLQEWTKKALKRCVNMSTMRMTIKYMSVHLLSNRVRTRATTHDSGQPPAGSLLLIQSTIDHGSSLSFCQAGDPRLLPR